MIPADDDDHDLPSEEIERRRDVRGLNPGIRLALRAPRVASFDVEEASRRSFFVATPEPEGYEIGELFEATISVGAEAVDCRLEVMRREQDPRSGVALRIAYIDAANERRLIELLGPLGDR
jgi:hypothetical protein